MVARRGDHRSEGEAGRHNAARRYRERRRSAPAALPRGPATARQDRYRVRGAPGGRRGPRRGETPGGRRHDQRLHLSQHRGPAGRRVHGAGQRGDPRGGWGSPRSTSSTSRSSSTPPRTKSPYPMISRRRSTPSRRRSAHSRPFHTATSGRMSSRSKMPRRPRRDSAGSPRRSARCAGHSSTTSVLAMAHCITITPYSALSPRRPKGSGSTTGRSPPRDLVPALVACCPACQGGHADRPYTSCPCVQCFRLRIDCISTVLAATHRVSR